MRKTAHFPISEKNSIKTFSTLKIKLKEKSLTFFLFLCLVLAESCPALPFPRDPDAVFPECWDPDGGAVGVGGGVFSGDSG